MVLKKKIKKMHFSRFIRQINSQKPAVWDKKLFLDPRLPLGIVVKP